MGEHGEGEGLWQLDVLFLNHGLEYLHSGSVIRSREENLLLKVTLDVLQIKVVLVRFIRAANDSHPISLLKVFRLLQCLLEVQQRLLVPSRSLDLLLLTSSEDLLHLVDVYDGRLELLGTSEDHIEHLISSRFLCVPVDQVLWTDVHDHGVALVGQRSHHQGLP